VAVGTTIDGPKGPSLDRSPCEAQMNQVTASGVCNNGVAAVIDTSSFHALMKDAARYGFQTFWVTSKMANRCV
jgi:hypothetical protein